ncbi:hypothetical protein [Arthrobacter sp. ISL-28]|uniref:hypothetical protein n=1 Tax=Arthrobacter sp. ISL-28 TaxID=2819108 RepID=UPI001BE5E71F|nr:hypothetical protein [Arthrobacter sp. ISL-28]MBT2520507.1 hypothetical protein [Arthrobacter sp. ISL-28]
MNLTKKVALSLSGAAVALAAGFGVTGMAAATTVTPTPTSGSPSATPVPDDHKLGGGKHGHHHGDRGAQVAALAAKLGVDEAKVADALRDFRDANRPPGPPADGQKPDGQKPDRRKPDRRKLDRSAMEGALAASLAKSLGIDEAKVKTALEELRTEAQKSRAAALKPRLDQAVSDGTLTQAEADAVTKAVERGVISGRR